MSGTDRTPDEIVTDHCALRYLQRVLDVDIGTADSYRETARLHGLCHTLGITAAQLKTSILAPDVRAALDAGASRMFYGGVWILFDCGRVTTVLVEDLRRHVWMQERRSVKLKHSPQLTPARRTARHAVSQFAEREL